MARFSADDLTEYLDRRRNWGRWGDDDQLGALNLITPKKRLAALQLARTGRTVSLSRHVPTQPGIGNPHPFQQYIRTVGTPEEGAVLEFHGAFYHGFACTHIDALNHIWGPDGLWNGRDPKREVTSEGVRWADVDKFSGGILTRAVLLDVPRHRGTSCVTIESPVHGDELAEIAEGEGVTVQPGDAIVVYSGRSAWEQDNAPWGFEAFVGESGEVVMRRPGLHASCLKFIRETDAAVIAWDMMDAKPNEYGVRYTIHAVLSQYGVALVDNCLLEPLAEACAAEGSYEFALLLAPLRIHGGTGSLINPIAIF